jgi:cell wall assembly regulator SMI1
MSFELAYTQWCDSLIAIGFAVGSFLNPPVAEHHLRAAEAQIGFALPDDLKALYRTADGQRPSFEVRDASPGVVVTPFFGAYDFIPLSDALTYYSDRKRVYDAASDAAGEDFNAFITVRGSDPVYPEYWRPGWFPFAVDGGGNAYAVDLSPAPGGAYGQVIVIGPDEFERRVLAPSITDLLLSASARPPEIEGEGFWRIFDAEQLLLK